MRRCVVFGGTGFVGSAIVLYLRTSEDYDEVLALGRSDFDLRDVTSMVRWLRPGDDVVNAAGIANASAASPSAVSDLCAANAFGATNAAEACEGSGVRFVVHVSSVAAQGPLRGIGLDESSMLPPASAYARSKLEGEIGFRKNIGGVPFVIVRPTSIVGAGRQLYRVLEKLSRLPVIPLPRAGRTLVPFSHVRNVSHGVALALSLGVGLDVPVIVGAERSVYLDDALRSIRADGKEGRQVSIPSRMFESSATLLDRARDSIGMEPLFGEGRIRMLLHDIEFSIERAKTVLDYAPVVPASKTFTW